MLLRLLVAARRVQGRGLVGAPARGLRPGRLLRQRVAAGQLGARGAGRRGDRTVAAARRRGSGRAAAERGLLALLLGLTLLRAAAPGRQRGARALTTGDLAARGARRQSAAGSTRAAAERAGREPGARGRTAREAGTATLAGRNLRLTGTRLAGHLLAALGDIDGQHDERGRTTGVGRAQLDADAVSQGQAADHEQTHAARDRDVHGGRRRQPLVDRGEVLGERPMPVSWISTRTRPSGSA